MKTVSLRRIFGTWWPLATSWLLMSVEVPALSAVVARLPDPEINLAAYGSVVFTLALIVEAPIIMLLAASTALSKDLASYQKVWRFMMIASAALTGLHILVAFTPFYYVVVERMLGVPQEIVEPARAGLKIMVPWTWSIAYRRFNQGMLIRFGKSRAIGIGTMVRLSADVLVLLIGYSIGTLPGTVVASSAVATGVVSEAIFVGIVSRPVLRTEVRLAPPVTPPLTWRAFYGFYVPLAMTSLMMLLANPMGTAALSRMPLSLESLAVWPVVTGLVFMLRSMGTAFNEVVVALLDEHGSYENLRRFAGLLAAISSAFLLLMTARLLSNFWLRTISALPEELVDLARNGLWFAFPLPALTVAQSWFQGALLQGHRTRGISESIVVYLLTTIVILGFGVVWGQVSGLYIGLTALTLSVGAQTVWLYGRSRSVLQGVEQRDRVLPETIA
jgi:hypothetical protein